MRAAIYARSSKERHDVSTDSQVAELRALAKREGAIVLRDCIFVDKEVSGRTDDRLAFQRLAKMVKSGRCPFERLYAFDTSRISRRREHAILYKRLFKRHGVELVFLKQPRTDSSTDVLVDGLFEVIAEWFSEVSKEGALRGMRANIQAGKRAGGAAPYGYTLEHESSGVVRDGKEVVKSKLVVDPATAPIVREYFERRANGEPRAAVLRDFNRRGIPSPRGRLWGGATGFALERNILCYLGHLVWGRSGEQLEDEYVRGQRWRPEAEWVVNENAHEAIITQDVADRVLALQGRRRAGKFRPKDTTYALTGILRCGVCGANYTGDGGHYACGNRRHAIEPCGNSRISQAFIEAEIQRFIAREFIRPEFYEEYIRAARAKL